MSQGLFHPELRSEAWFDAKLIPAAWVWDDLVAIEVGNYLELIGASYGAATATAALSALKSLAGESAGTSAISAWLSAVAALVGMAQGTGQATGELSSTRTLAGTSSGAAQTSALLSALKALAGLSTGSTVCDAILELVQGGTTYLELIGASAGQTSADGSLSVLVPLAGESLGQTNATAALSTLIALKGGSAGAGLSSAELSAVMALIGSSQGQTAIASLLDLRDIFGVLVSSSAQETTVEIGTRIEYAVTPSNALVWAVTLDEGAAYVDAETEYLGELVE